MRLKRLVQVYTCQNVKLLEITCRGSFVLITCTSSDHHQTPAKFQTHWNTTVGGVAFTKYLFIVSAVRQVFLNVKDVTIMSKSHALLITMSKQHTKFQNDRNKTEELRSQSTPFPRDTHTHNAATDERTKNIRLSGF